MPREDPHHEHGAGVREEVGEASQCGDTSHFSSGALLMTEVP